jgi:hypothetical protein
MAKHQGKFYSYQSTLVFPDARFLAMHSPFSSVSLFMYHCSSMVVDGEAGRFGVTSTISSKPYPSKLCHCPVLLIQSNALVLDKSNT